MRLKLTYRTRRKLQRIGLVTLVLLLVGLLVWTCWVVWLDRYMVYSREGAALNFQLKDAGTGQVAAPPSADETVPIYYNEGENAIDATTELGQIKGYYIDADMLKDVAGVLDTVSKLPGGTAVMLEIKNAKGSFFYNSRLTDAVMSGNVDCAAVSNLISEITSRNLYAIAVLPAFRDYQFGLNNVSSGLPVSQGYLWADDDYCYWLNPANAGTLNWLKSIMEELRELGFDEVVFTEFRFPDTTSIVFNGDKAEALVTAANTLVTTSATHSFAVSFMADTAFALPAGRSRLYLQNVSAKNVDATVAATTVADPTINLVFMATTNDTRFDAYSVLRPLNTLSVE